MSEILLEVTMGKGERHRNFDAEFKREVLRLMAEGNPAVKVAEDLGIRVDLIYAWRKQEKWKVRAVAFAESGGKELSPEEKLKALREELAATKRERDILKKPWPSSQKNPRVTEIRDCTGSRGRLPCGGDVPMFSISNSQCCGSI